MRTRVIESRSLGSRPTVVGVATLAVADIGPWLGRVYGDVARYLAECGERPYGPPFASYHRIGDDRFQVEAGFPVATHLPGAGNLRGSSLPAGTVAITTHIGPYEEMSRSYGALTSWIESRGGEPLGDAWEIYYSEPTQPPESWRTDIVQPYRAA